MILKRFLVAILILPIKNIATAQSCNYTVTVSSNGATCLQNDTLKVTGAVDPSSIVWYKNGDSVSGSSLLPTVIAGRKTGNGSGSTPERLNEPQGIEVDRLGNIFIADLGNHRIQKWAPGATQGTTVAGGYDYDDDVPNEMKIYSPYDVGVDSSGNFYTIDRSFLRIQKWVPGSALGITIADGIANAQALGIAFGLHVTRNGTCYVSDFGHYRVQKWLPGATTGITVAGGNGYGNADNQIAFPCGVFVDERDETVYVTDINNNRVQKWIAGAESGITVAGGNGAGNAANQLNTPWGIFVTGDKTVYVADASNARVQKWLDGAISGITVAGGNGSGNGADQLSSPMSVYLDSAANIFVSEAGNNRVQKWTPGSTSGTTVAGNPIGSANVAFNPGDIVTDREGNVYISDLVSNSIIKYFVGSTDSIIVAGGNGQGNAANQFSRPVGIFVDSSHTVYVCDQLNSRIQKWTAGAATAVTVAGGTRGSAADQLSDPNSVFVDRQGNIFIADAGNHRIQKWLPGASSGITVAGGNGMGTGNNQLYRPADMVVDDTGNLYIADAFNNRIQKWQAGAASGVTIAGDVAGYPAGKANRLNMPYSIYIDDSMNMYIADYHNHRIQKWRIGADSGVTVAGSTKYYGSLTDQLLQPKSIWRDKFGNLYTTDNMNGRAQKWPGKIDTSFVPTSPGTYTAIVKGRNPVCTASSNAVVVNTGFSYQFTGNGNWSSPLNWMNSHLPPATLPACSKIIVSPASGSTCILDVPQTISNGANITVFTGSNFVINGNLTIQ